MELFPLARRFSALADNPDTAAELLEALVSHMEGVYQLVRADQRITADIPDAEIAADIWDLPAHLRPVPIVLLVDEVAELALSPTKADEPRRDRIITALVRLAQLGRAAGIYLEICGQRFGSELGKGITMLRAQLTARTAHRVNDETSANMAFGDIAPDAVLAAISIPTDTPGLAVTGDSTGGWARIRTPTPRCARPSTPATGTPTAPRCCPASPPSGPNCRPRIRSSRSRPRPRHTPPPDPTPPVGATASRQLPTPAMPKTERNARGHPQFPAEEVPGLQGHRRDR